MDRKILQELQSASTISVAKSLLGMALVLNGRPLGLIVETEAYLGAKDAACHSFQGRRTAKNQSMYLSAGHWYVYQIYGYQMLNFVTGPAEIPEAVLIRALEVPENLANGPGKLTRFSGIDKSFDGQDLASSTLTLARGREPQMIKRRARIGVTCGEPWKSEKLGFYVAGSAAVSHCRKSELTKQVWL